ncbi:hypothetical protein [Streptomyces sp. NPDC001717]|uniref:hypothetical protein n=1 Tax=Streptomyces sp. NPDC001717 TaxID=3364604 RepID=UPI0036C74356
MATFQRLPDGSEHRTGVWIANQRRRHVRLDGDQLAALTELSGLDRTTAAPPLRVTLPS